WIEGLRLFLHARWKESRRRHCLDEWLGQEVSGLLVGLQERFQLLTQRGVAAASFIEKSGSFPGRSFAQCRRENVVFVHATPLVGLQGRIRSIDQCDELRPNAPRILKCIIWWAMGGRLRPAIDTNPSIKPGTRVGPMAIGRARRNLQNLRRFVERQAGKRSQLNELGLDGI